METSLPTSVLFISRWFNATMRWLSRSMLPPLIVIVILCILVIIQKMDDHQARQKRVYDHIFQGTSRPTVISVQENPLREHGERTPVANEPKMVSKSIITDSGPRLVILLSCQRCGSSFVGDFFGTNPDVFYWYEPLDGVYQALYGTASGWNVPSDIFTYTNGTLRDIPEVEHQAITDTLHHILLCNMKSVTAQTLISEFHGRFSLNVETLTDFRQCLASRDLGTGRCRERHLVDICYPRFDPMFDMLPFCRDNLRTSRRNETPDVFEQYNTCTASEIVKAEPCTDILQSQCLQANIRVIKTVRMTMESAARLFDHVGDLDLGIHSKVKVIHLIRDPRAVARSRMFNPSFRGQTTMLVSEAAAYCANTMRDIKKRKDIELRHPGSTMQVVYEDVIHDPMGYLSKMYSFIGEEKVNTRAMLWVKLHTHVISNSSAIADRWRDKLAMNDIMEINIVCDQLLREIYYN